MEFYYCRVSSMNQCELRQTEEAVRLGIAKENIYVDKASGKNTDRPQLQMLLKVLREGDVLHVHSFDRLARSTRDLLSLVDEFGKRGITLISHKENLDTDTPQGKLMLSVFASIAQFQREIIREAQQEGIAIAKRDGRMGRPRASKEKLDLACTMYESGKYKMREIESATGISYGTIYREIHKRNIKRT